MKRFAILLLALMVVVLPVAAQQPADLSALARYFPASAPLYAGFRTDEGYIAALEAIRAHFAAALPAAAMNDQTVMDALDEAVGQMTNSDGTFADAVRSWLGDTAAAGALNFDAMMQGSNDGPALIALSITDRAAAQAFFENLGPEGQSFFDVEATDAYTLLIPTYGGGANAGAIYIDDEVLLITNKPEALPTSGLPDPSLATQPQFEQAVAGLPAESYDILVYGDYGAILQTAMADASAMNPDDAAVAAMIEPFFSAFGGMAAGFTVLDGRALTMDVTIGMNPDSTSTLVSDLSEFPAFDPAFAQHLPAGTQLAVQATDLAGTFEQSLASLSMMQDIMSGAANGEPVSPEAGQRMLAGLNFAIRGVTGLDLQDDILSWMTGQYAVGMLLDLEAFAEAGFSGDVPPRALSFALVIENTTGEGAQALVAGLSDGLAQLNTMGRGDGATLSEEEIGGEPAILISVDSPRGRDPFELVIGGNAEVFVIGTPDMARAALAPDGGLDSDPGYQESLAWALPDSPAFLYGSGDFLNGIITRSMLGTAGSGNQPELAMQPIFSSISGSGTYSDTILSSRLVMALAE